MGKVPEGKMTSVVIVPATFPVDMNRDLRKRIDFGFQIWGYKLPWWRRQEGQHELLGHVMSEVKKQTERRTAL